MLKTSYWDKIPQWDDNSPETSFDILSDRISGRIPVTRIENWRDFEKVFSHKFFNGPSQEMLFRGQRRYDWQLAPSLGRLNSSGIIFKDIAKKQLDLFRKAIRGRISDHSLLIDDDLENDELWSIGQHHGLNTPLLDWTYSPYVALFFSFLKEDLLEEEENSYRAIYLLDKEFIANDEICPDIRVFEPRKDDYGRLVSQAGLFTFSPYGSTLENKLLDYLSSESDDEDILENASEIEQAGIIAKYICKVYIKNENQTDCLKYLRRMNVHHGSLFPDLLGAAEFCNLSLIENERIKQYSAEELNFDLNNENDYIPHDKNKVHSSLGKVNSVSDLLSIYTSKEKIDSTKINFISREIADELTKVTEIPYWEDRSDLVAELKSKTRVILRKHSYPQEDREKVISEIVNVIRNEQDE